MKPLISCVMPTISGREAMRSEAVACFEAQTWPNRELVIVADPGTVGAKRNMAVSRAKGEIIAHWDDDDLSAPDRLAEQYALLTESEADMVGFHQMEFFDGEGRWMFTARQGYALGTSLMYWKDAWRARPFNPSRQVGEDNEFITGRNIVTVPAGDLMRARIHPGNTSDKVCQLGSREYQKIA